MTFDLSIDENALDVEWNNQSEKYYEVATDLANARQELDAASNELKLVNAELDLDIRSNPAKYGVAKVTEGSIESAITVHPEHQSALLSVRTAKHRVDILTGAVEAMQQRKKALEKMVDLFLANYHSAPKVRNQVSSEAMTEGKKVALRRKGIKKKAVT